MSDQHTPGRIYFRANGDANSYALMDQATNNWRMTILLNGEQVTAQQAADLERMAACWNACLKVPTEVLEAQQSGGLPWNVADQIDQCMRLDELLQALKGLEEAYCRAGSPLTRDERLEDRKRLMYARAAIAKATGSAT